MREEQNQKNQNSHPYEKPSTPALSHWFHFFTCLLFLMSSLVLQSAEKSTDSTRSKSTMMSGELNVDPLVPKTLEDEEELKVQDEIRWPVRTLNLKDIERQVLAEETQQ